MKKIISFAILLVFALRINAQGKIPADTIFSGKGFTKDIVFTIDSLTKRNDQITDDIFQTPQDDVFLGKPVFKRQGNISVIDRNNTKYKIQTITKKNSRTITFRIFEEHWKTDTIQKITLKEKTKDVLTLCFLIADNSHTTIDSPPTYNEVIVDSTEQEPSSEVQDQNNEHEKTDKETFPTSKPDPSSNKPHKNDEYEENDMELSGYEKYIPVVSILLSLIVTCAALTINNYSYRKKLHTIYNQLDELSAQVKSNLTAQKRIQANQDINIETLKKDISEALIKKIPTPINKDELKNEIIEVISTNLSSTYTNYNKNNINSEDNSRAEPARIIGYTKKIDINGISNDDILPQSDEYTIYRIEKINDKEAYYYIYTDPEALENLFSVSYMIPNHTDLTNGKKASRIATVEHGILQYETGRWVVIKPLKFSIS